MPKKNAKKSVSKRKTKEVQPKKQINVEHFNQHRYFLVVLVVFVGFAIYSLTSFVSSNDDFIDNAYTDISSDIPFPPQPDTGPVSQELTKKNPFTDFDATHENAYAIVELYYKGVLAGYADGTFRPNNKINRAEFAKMLVEAADLDYTEIAPEQLKNCFTDVKDVPDHWFAPAVCASRVSGWINGYSDGSFWPIKNINKAEALKIVLTAFEITIPQNSDVSVMPYDDVSQNDWFLGVAVAAKAAGISSDKALFVPNFEVTRGQVAQMIYAALEAKDLVENHI